MTFQLFYIIDFYLNPWLSGFPGGCASGKEPTFHTGYVRGCEFDPWVGKIPWGRACQPTPIFLPGEPHGPRRYSGYSPWGLKYSDDWKDLAHMQRCLRIICHFLSLKLFMICFIPNVDFLHESSTWVWEKCILQLLDKTNYECQIILFNSSFSGHLWKKCSHSEVQEIHYWLFLIWLEIYAN